MNVVGGVWDTRDDVVNLEPLGDFYGGNILWCCLWWDIQGCQSRGVSLCSFSVDDRCLLGIV